MSAPGAIPNTAAVAFNAANAAFREQDYATALEHANTALKAMPDFAVAHLMRARSLRALNNVQNARAAYLDVLSTEPQNFSAHLELGNVQRQLGAPSEAAASYTKAIASRPEDHRGYLASALLYIAFEEPGAAEKAATHYHRALMVASGDLAIARRIHAEIARARLAAGRPDMALEASRQAWMTRLVDRDHVVDPEEDAQLLCDMARAYLRLGLEPDARKALETAARASGSMVLREIAVICYDANFWEDGIAVLRRAVSLHPSDVDTHLALADMLSRCWKLEEARAALEAADKAAPLSSATRHQLLGKIASSLGDAETSLAHYGALVDLDVVHATSSVAMTSLYSSKKTAEQVATLHRAMFARLGNGARERDSFSNDLTSDRPLRIGMVTADLHRQHPVNLFMQPLLQRWPNAELPLTLYFTGSSYDAQTRLAKERVPQWREVTYAELAAQVAQDQIDILIDLAGHTSHRAMACFAQRLAPVQVSYLGYPGSTGVPNMDWMIADSVVAPEANADQFSEQLMHLPHSVFCFAPEADHPMPDLGEDVLNRPLTFGSFNNIPKLTPDTVALWARVMEAIAGSRLVLKAPSFQDATVVARYSAMFADQGITADRISFRGPCRLDEMMQEYADIDIGLDPIHYGGGTTTLQAMWMGVPVLTLEGDKFASRMGSSFMQAAGMDQFVARNADDFVRKAQAAAGDRTVLLALKRGLREHLIKRPAWDPDLFAEDFAKCLRKIWKQSTGNTGRASQPNDR